VSPSREVASRELIVALLAAGRSSRMGRPKALVELDGERALARLLRLARNAELRALVVFGFDAADIQSGLGIELADARVVVNPRPELGQSSSVRLAAQQLVGEQSLVLWPVDHARVAEATFRRLLAAFRARSPSIEMVVPSYRGRRGHPLLAGPGARRELAALKDDEPAHGVVRRDLARVLHVTVDDPMVVADFDTPEDLRSQGKPERPRRRGERGGEAR